jgi:hypothetical protein
MAEGSSSSASGEDPFLEVKAISRVLSSEATRGPDWTEVSFGVAVHLVPVFFSRSQAVSVAHFSYFVWTV